MTPNPQFKLDSEGNRSMDDINSKMINGEDSLINAATSAEKTTKPEAETPSEKIRAEILKLIEKDGQSAPADADAEPPATDEGQVDDDVYIGLIDSAPGALLASSKDADEPSVSNSEGEKAQNSATEAEAKEGGEEKENLNDKETLAAPPTERRSSSELRGDLQSNGLLNSVKTADSWGGKEGSLPPLPTSASFNNNEGDASDLDDDDSSAGSSPSPQDKSTHPTEQQTFSGKDVDNVANPAIQHSNSSPSEGLNKDCDNVANYVNFNKLLQPGSSQYYYSRANSNNRQMFEKVKSKKKSDGNLLLDDSAHSKVSVLTVRSRVSSYRGPTPLKKDGKVPKSIIKVKQGRSESVVSFNSLPSKDNSLPSKEGGDESKVPGMRRCSFSCVDIREHERVAGDNPCVSTGVPLSLGWGHYQHESIRLDDYELNKGPSRDKIEMMVPPGVRKEMLRDGFGVSISDMNAAMREVTITKRQRRHTVATEHMEGWTEAMQSAKRKLNRFVKRTSTEKEAKKVWSQAQKSAVSGFGKNPGSASVGSINKGTKIGPANNGEEAPVMEISFQDGADEAPTF